MHLAQIYSCFCLVLCHTNTPLVVPCAWSTCIPFLQSIVPTICLVFSFLHTSGGFAVFYGNGLPPTPNTLHLGCSYHLDSSHHFFFPLKRNFFPPITSQKTQSVVQHTYLQAYVYARLPYGWERLVSSPDPGGARGGHETRPRKATIACSIGTRRYYSAQRWPQETQPVL